MSVIAGQRYRLGLALVCFIQAIALGQSPAKVGLRLSSLAARSRISNQLL